ncbi:MAG: phage/plasmid primase, P4 family [Rhizobiaceae bacterium]
MLDNPLQKLANERIWVGYKGANSGGKIDKIPIDPNTGRNAKNNDQLSWGTKAHVVNWMKNFKAKHPGFSPGFGVQLTSHGENNRLIGIDLDGCVDTTTGAVEIWAEKILEKISSYSEISPSGSGIKIFCFIGVDEFLSFKKSTRVKHKAEFKISSHHGFEIHLSNSYFTVTENQFVTPNGENNNSGIVNIRRIDLGDLNWLYNVAGPRLIEKPAKNNPSDESGSGHGFRFALAEAKKKASYAEFCDRIREDQTEAGDWANRSDERQLRRAFNNAQKLIQEEGEAILEAFPKCVDLISNGWRPAANEISAVDVLAREEGNQYKYNATQGSWLLWNGSYWASDEKGEINSTISDVCVRLDGCIVKGARNLLRSTSVNGIRRLAENRPEFSTVERDWDNEPNLLTTPGQLIDLKSGKSKDPDSTILMKQCTEVAPLELVDFDANVHCPRWISFLNEALESDETAINFLKTWFGYCLTGNTREHKFLFIHGTGRSGKSTLVNVIRNILGSFAIQIESEVLSQQTFSQHTTSIARINGKRFVVANETKENRKWDQQRLKQLTGGDPIIARYMRQDDFQFDPKLKLMVVGNHQPSVSSVEKAMKERLLVLGMNAVPQVIDRNLQEKLMDEAQGILTWMIQGSIDWYDKGLVIPQSIKTKTDDYFSQQDVFQEWLDEACEVSQNYSEQSSNLWSSWQCYAQKSSISPGTKTSSFPDAMREHGFQASRNIGPERSRGYIGLRLKLEELDDETYI